MMNEETLSIVHKYISIEWARKTLEHDLMQIQRAGLKYPVLFGPVVFKDEGLEKRDASARNQSGCDRSLQFEGPW